VAEGLIAAHETAVLVLTGHAGKDPPPPAADLAEAAPLVDTLEKAERALSAERRR
jgi:hypothetical protein